MKLIIAIITAILIYALQKKIFRKLWNHNLNVKIGFGDEFVEAGQNTYLTEVINNAKFLPLPVLHVKFSVSRSFRFKDYENASVTDCYHRNDAFSVMGNQKITRRLDFEAQRRGFYSIEGLNIIAKDFFMTGTFAENVENRAELYVFPRKLDDVRLQIMFNNILGELEARNSMLEDPYAFRGIRDYNNSDSMSKINWKATAKATRLMVNLYNHTSEQKVKLLLNMDTNYMIKSEYLQETGIELASTLAAKFLSSRIPVMVESNGVDFITGDCQSVDAGSSLNHMASIDKYLARINGNGGIEHFFNIIDREIALCNTNITYIVISTYYRDDLLLKLDYMRSCGIDIHMIIPYYDRLGLECKRCYMTGWEVKLVET